MFPLHCWLFREFRTINWGQNPNTDYIYNVTAGHGEGPGLIMVSWFSTRLPLITPAGKSGQVISTVKWQWEPRSPCNSILQWRCVVQVGLGHIFQSYPPECYMTHMYFHAQLDAVVLMLKIIFPAYFPLPCFVKLWLLFTCNRSWLELALTKKMSFDRKI